MTAVVLHTHAGMRSVAALDVLSRSVVFLWAVFVVGVVPTTHPKRVSAGEGEVGIEWMKAVNIT